MRKIFLVLAWFVYKGNDFERSKQFLVFTWHSEPTFLRPKIFSDPKWTLTKMIFGGIKQSFLSKGYT